MGCSSPSLGEVGKGMQLVSLLFRVRERRAALHFEVYATSQIRSSGKERKQMPNTLK